MRSTTYDRIVAEGRAEIVAALLRDRLGDEATPFLSALAAADEARLLAIGRAIARHTSRAKLRAALEALGGEAKGRARPRRPRR